jgi:nucleolin
VILEPAYTVTQIGLAMWQETEEQQLERKLKKKKADEERAERKRRKIDLEEKQRAAAEADERAADEAERDRGSRAAVRPDGAGGGVAPDGCLIYVGGLPFNYDEAQVRSAFADCGEILHVHCMRFPDSGKFRGIALVTFVDEAAGEKCKAWDGQQWEGRFLVIKPGKALPKAARAHASDGGVGGVSGVRTDERPKPAGSTTAYVGNLNFDTTAEELETVFAGATIAGVRFATDKTTGRPKGIAFIEFADEAALERAMLKNGQTVRGRELAMHYSTTTGPSAKVRETVAEPAVMQAGRGGGAPGGRGGAQGGRGSGGKRSRR